MRICSLCVPLYIIGFTRAFLLPPEIFSTDNNAFDDFVLNDLTYGNELLVLLDFPGSAGSADAEGNIIVGPTESVLELNFTLQHHEKFDNLLLNDQVVYPFLPDSGSFPALLSAPHLAKTDQGTWKHTEYTNFCYSVDPYHSILDQDFQPLGIVRVIINIIAISGNTLDKRPTIELQLNETPPGKLTIKNVIMKIPQSPIFSDAQDPEICNSILCRLKESLSQMLTSTKELLKSCPMMLQHHLAPQQEDEAWSSNIYPVALKPTNIDEPTYQIFSHSNVISFLIPVLVGLAAGVSVGIMGVIFGHIFIFLRSIFCRRRYNQYTSVEQDDNVSEVLYHKEKLQAPDLVPDYSDIVEKPTSL